MAMEVRAEVKGLGRGRERMRLRNPESDLRRDVRREQGRLETWGSRRQLRGADCRVLGWRARRFDRGQLSGWGGKVQW